MKEAIQIAANTKCYGLTNKPNYHGKLKNKNCGDEIQIEFNIKKNCIINFRYEGEMCIYCQASASIIANTKINLHQQKLKKIQNQIYDFFNDKIKFKFFVIKKFSLIVKKKKQPTICIITRTPSFSFIFLNFFHLK